MTIEATLTLGDPADPDPQHRLDHLLRERDNLPGLLAACRKVGTAETLGQLEQRQTAIEREITFARIAAARADVANRLARVRMADDRVEPVRVEAIKAASACESAKHEYARRRAESDRSNGELTMAQQAVMEARRKLAGAEDRLQRLLDDDTTPTPTPTLAVGHQPVDGPLPIKGAGVWDRSFVGCRRDE